MVKIAVAIVLESDEDDMSNSNSHVISALGAVGRSRRTLICLCILIISREVTSRVALDQP